MSETVEYGENPNTSPYRHILLIDPTENETAVDLLFSHELCDSATTVVCSVGDFAQDKNTSSPFDFHQCDAVLRVKSAMEQGNVVVLVNSGDVQSYFYDILNQLFTLLAVGPDDGYEYPYNQLHYTTKFV